MSNIEDDVEMVDGIEDGRYGDLPYDDVIGPTGKPSIGPSILDKDELS